VFDYQYEDQLVNETPIKKIVLATESLGAPPPSYLRTAQRHTRHMAKEYLEDHGYVVLPSYHFDNAWKQALRSYGNPYDPTTGKIDSNAWRAAMITTATSVRDNTDADAIVFVDVFEHEVSHAYGMKHYARFYGVNRKPSLKGPGTGVPMSFDWYQPIKAASVMVTIYDVNLNRIFASRGGIDTLYAVDIKSSNPKFVRKKKLIDSENHIEEGLELAFHPFIPMSKYPGPTPEEKKRIEAEKKARQ
jgi:hypothetical protein